mmetsp:Transcript_32616/g.87567  ORF Transcript_32616/g.87567 Transcript_32616/m.87567 type:complete len:270 (-) Transcript_32616:4270-5079(-)
MVFIIARTSASTNWSSSSSNSTTNIRTSDKQPISWSPSCFHAAWQIFEAHKRTWESWERVLDNTAVMIPFNCCPSATEQSPTRATCTASSCLIVTGESSQPGRNSNTSSMAAKGSVNAPTASSMPPSSETPSLACCNPCPMNVSTGSETSNHHQVWPCRTSLRCLTVPSFPSPHFLRLRVTRASCEAICMACLLAAIRQVTTSFITCGKISSTKISGASVVRLCMKAARAIILVAQLASKMSCSPWTSVTDSTSCRLCRVLCAKKAVLC